MALTASLTAILESCPSSPRHPTLTPSNPSGAEAEDLALSREKFRRRLPESLDELRSPTLGIVELPLGRVRDDGKAAEHDRITGGGVAVLRHAARDKPGQETHRPWAALLRPSSKTNVSIRGSRPARLRTCSRALQRPDGLSGHASFVRHAARTNGLRHRHAPLPFRRMRRSRGVVRLHPFSPPQTGRADERNQKTAGQERFPAGSRIATHST